jgi:hypothetical protein
MANQNPLRAYRKLKYNEFNVFTIVLGNTYHTHHSRFIPVGVAVASQIFLRDAHFYLVMSNTADVTGGKPIAV